MNSLPEGPCGVLWGHIPGGAAGNHYRTWGTVHFRVFMNRSSPRPEHTIVNRETSAIKAPAGGGWDKYFGLANSSPHGPRAGWTGGRLAGHP